MEQGTNKPNHTQTSKQPSNQQTTAGGCSLCSHPHSFALAKVFLFFFAVFFLLFLLCPFVPFLLFVASNFPPHPILLPLPPSTGTNSSSSSSFLLLPFSLPPSCFTSTGKSTLLPTILSSPSLQRVHTSPSLPCYHFCRLSSFILFTDTLFQRSFPPLNINIPQRVYLQQHTTHTPLVTLPFCSPTDTYCFLCYWTPSFHLSLAVTFVHINFSREQKEDVYSLCSVSSGMYLQHTPGSPLIYFLSPTIYPFHSIALFITSTPFPMIAFSGTRTFFWDVFISPDSFVCVSCFVFSLGALVLFHFDRAKKNK